MSTQLHTVSFEGVGYRVPINVDQEWFTRIIEEQGYDPAEAAEFLTEAAAEENAVVEYAPQAREERRTSRKANRKTRKVQNQEDTVTEKVQTEVTETVVVAEEPTIVAECPAAQPFEIGVPDMGPTRPDRAEIEAASIVNAPRRIGAYDREALEKWTVEQAMSLTLPASDAIVLVSGREAIDEARALGYQGVPKGFFSARTMGRALALLELTISAEWDWIYAPWEPHSEGGYVRGAVLTRADGIKRVVADVTSAGVRGWYTVEVQEVTNADGELTLAVERAGSEVKVNRFYYDAPGIVDKENASLEEWCATNGVRFYPRSAPPAKHAVVADIMLNAKKFFVFDNDKGSYRQAMLDGYRDQMARAHGVDPDELYKARRAAQ